jgi:hypothetical protein
MTGQPVRGTQDRTAGTGQVRPDKICLDRTERAGWPVHDRKGRNLGQDNRNRITVTGQLIQAREHKSAIQFSLDRSALTELKGHDGQKMTLTT